MSNAELDPTELQRIARQFNEASGPTAAEAAEAFELAATRLNNRDGIRDPHINATLLHESEPDETP